MIASEWLIIGLIAVGLVVFIGEPLVRRQLSHELDTAQDLEVDQLTLQKETLYTAIRDLDFDYHTGKVDDVDYTDLRQQLEGEAIDTLRALDQVDPLAVLDDELEREIAALRRPDIRSAQAAMTPGDEPACRSCGAAIEGGDHFCPACGQSLSPA